MKRWKVVITTTDVYEIDVSGVSKEDAEQRGWDFSEHWSNRIDGYRDVEVVDIVEDGTEADRRYRTEES